MAEKKQSVLAVLEILQKYSDQDHLVSIRQISSLLESEYQIRIERRAIYANIEILRDFGYDISAYERERNGYYLNSRNFDKGEILLLCNAIHASHFISAKQSDDLIAKLLATQSIYQAKEFNDKVYLPNPLKTPNKQLIYTIETVSEAIRDNLRLAFTYLHYDLDKKLVPRREKEYVVEPRYIVYADSRAYMIVNSEKHPNFSHYRLDRIKDARILPEHSSELKDKDDAYEYARNKLFMYAGESSYVSFLCDNTIIDQMIDIFGTSVILMNFDADHFLIRVKTSTQGALYLAQQYLDSLSIYEPQELRQEFIASLEKRLQDYKKL